VTGTGVLLDGLTVDIGIDLRNSSPGSLNCLSSGLHL